MICRKLLITNYLHDFIQYNSPFQKSKINQITIQSSNTLSEFTILLRFSKSKSFSFKIPNSWTTKKLISFILQTFKSEILNSIPNFIYKGNIMQPFDESLLINKNCLIIILIRLRNLSKLF